VRCRAAAVAFAALLPATAHAHLVDTGFGGFYDGLAHLVSTPADLLVVIALALLAGRSGAPAARRALLAVPLAWVAGGLLGARSGLDPSWAWPTTLTFGLVGLAVALDARLRPAAVVAVVAVASLVHGAMNGAAMAADAGGLRQIAGAATAAFVLLTLVAAEASALRAAWSRIAVRVAGSWIAAAALLMVGWLARPSG
jgi:hydrogenase/urease accessory protein HupE